MEKADQWTKERLGPVWSGDAGPVDHVGFLKFSELDGPRSGPGQIENAAGPKGLLWSAYRTTIMRLDFLVRLRLWA